MTAELKQIAATSAPASVWKPYPVYKDSGVEWIGRVPEHWEVSTIKRIVANHMQGYYSNQDYVSDGVKLLRITDIDDFSNINFSECPFVSVNEKEISDFGLEINDFLFARSGTIGRFGILRKKEKAVFASYLIRFRFSKKLDADFLKYYFFSEYFKQSLISDLHGGANQNIHAENIKNQIITIPSYPEQRAISLYLDDRTRKIDTLIEKKQKLNDLLKEERAATINQAVTKGMNPNVPMKGSGIEWIGEIPKHWEAKRLKYVAKLKSGEFINAENINPIGNFPVLGGNGLRGYTNTFTHEGNYILIGRQGALCGNINLVDGKFYATEHAVVVTIIDKSETIWLAELLRAMNLNQHSQASAQPGLAVETIKNLFIPFPPYKEQKEIVSLITSENERIKSTISKIENEVSLLQEYRTSLISEVVSGKIDVREAA